MDKQAVEILTKARALIRKGWCQNTAAQGASGRDVFTYSPRAVKWCAAGALERARSKQSLFEAASSERFLNRAIEFGYASYIAFNDAKGRKKSEVLAMFTRAIKLAKE